MEEIKLLRIAIVCSLLGITILFVLGSLTQVDYMDIKDISIDNIDDTVKLKGLVTNIRSSEKVTIIEISQHNRMPVLIFENNVNLNPGDEIEILGKVTEYNGDIEVIADSIELI